MCFDLRVLPVPKSVVVLESSELLRRRMSDGFFSGRGTMRERWGDRRVC